MRYLFCALVLCSCASQNAKVELMYDCPIIRVERVESIVGPDGATIKIMRLDACGKKAVWERRNLMWEDVSDKVN